MGVKRKTPVVILHGWGANGTRWALVQAALEAVGFVVFTPDLPGHGSQPDPDHSLRVEDFGEFVLGFLKDNNIKKAHIVGHSNGGRTALWLAAHYPEKISKLVLVAAAGLPRTQPIRSEFIQTASSSSVASILKPLRRIARTLFGSSDYRKASPVMQETMKKLLAYDATKDAKSIKNKTLIVWGKLDTYVPVEDATRLNKLIKLSKKIVYPDQKHGPHITIPSRLASDIANFLT